MFNYSKEVRENIFNSNIVRINNLICPPPTQIIFSITDRCNLHCRYCECSVIQTHESIDMINPDIIYNMKYEISKARSLVFTGIGEPFLNKNIFDFFIFLRKNNKDCPISVTTNGTIPFTKEQIRILCKNEIYLIFSIDSLEQSVNEKTRPGSKVKNITDNINKLLKIAQQENLPIPPMALNCVVTQINYKHLVELAKFVVDKKFIGLSLLNLNFNGIIPIDTFSTKVQVNSETMKEAIPYIRKVVRILKENGKSLGGTFTSKYILDDKLAKKLMNLNTCIDPWCMTVIRQDNEIWTCYRRYIQKIGIIDLNKKIENKDELLNKLYEKIYTPDKKLEKQLCDWIHKTNGIFLKEWNGEKMLKIRDDILKKRSSACRQCISEKIHNSWYPCT